MAATENNTEAHKLVVAPHEGLDHGYWGYVPDETPNEAYTVTGQVGATAKADDTPKSTTKGASK